MTKKRDAVVSGDWAADQLLRIADDEGQKKRVSALDPDARALLNEALRVVGMRKARAYARACEGAVPNLFGWIAADPELTSATALLNSHFILVSSIPMLPSEHAPTAAQHPSAPDEAQAPQATVESAEPVTLGQADFGF